jgi:ribonuclease-3 family protein
MVQEGGGAAGDLLESAEQKVYAIRRGRNAHTNRTGSAYHHATGLEALFGYLYLDGRIDRVRELFRLATAPQEDGCKEVSL